MHHSKHVHRGHRRTARIAVAIASSALLCSAAAGPALASARHSRPHRPAAHTSAKPSAPLSVPPSGASGWASYYIVRTIKSSHDQVIYELAVKRLGNGDLSLDAFQLGEGSSVPPGGDVIKPGWILVLPANGSAPTGPTGPLTTVSQASGAPATSQGTRSAGSAGGGAGTVDRTGRGVASAATSKRARLAQAAGIGSVILVALLLAAGLLIRRHRGRRRTGQPDRRDRPRLSWRPGRPGRTGGRRGGSTAGAPASQALASNPGWGASSTRPTLALPAPVPAPSGGGVVPQQVAVPELVAVPEPVAAGAAGPGDASWPDYLMPAQPVPPVEPVEPMQRLSPMALRMLAAQRSDGTWDETTDAPVQRLHVASGDDRIEVVLAKAPAGGHDGRPHGGAWLASSPYLVWSPLPYDVPGDGVAFACLGTGDEGCLFIDLAAAPGAIALGGDRAAAARLAESIAHQLSMAGDASHQRAVVVVGGAVPGPLPAEVIEVATISGLGQAAVADLRDPTRIVFCELHSNEEAFALARYTATAPHRVVPVVLADLPGAAWSFTAQPSPRPGQPLAQ